MFNKNKKLKFYPKTDHFRDLCAESCHGIRDLSDTRSTWMCCRVGDIRIVEMIISNGFFFVQCRHTNHDKQVRHRHCRSLFERRRKR